MSIHQIIFPLIIVFLLLGACSQGQEVSEAQNPFGEETVATINGEPIYTSIFQRYSNMRLQKNADDLSDDERDGLIEELVQFYLMSNAATNAGIAQEQDVIIELELQRLQMLSRLMATRHLEENLPSEAELQIAYEQNIQRLSGTQYKARHILLDEESEAIEVIEELRGGADFQELATTRSTGPSGPNGGDLGWFSADTMVPPFAQAVSSMEAGTFSEEPVRTRFGWHIILLEDTLDSQPPGLEAVRADITNFVEQRKIEDLLNSLRAESVIDIGD
jgi:peptidyl-prolyl cis-trans isomerase C